MTDPQCRVVFRMLDRRAFQFQRSSAAAMSTLPNHANRSRRKSAEELTQGTMNRTVLHGGNRRIFLQPRDWQVLEMLWHRRILDRDQISAIAPFGSVSRVNVRLKQLRNSGILLRYFISSRTGSRKSVYALSRIGAKEICKTFLPLRFQPDSAVFGNAFVAHQLALNDIYISAHHTTAVSVRWKEFSQPISASFRLVPDALIEVSENGAWCSMFLEVDLGTEGQGIWTGKTRSYLQLAVSGAFKDVAASNRFAVLIVTDTEERMRTLRTAIAKRTAKLFWFTTLESIKQRGFWSPVWLRPIGNQQVPPGA